MIVKKMAKEKNLNLVAGFCWRYANHIVDTFDQIHNHNAIGDIVAYYATYYTSPVKPMPPASTRKPGMTDLEWQLRNWYNFAWLGGDGYVEQCIHSVDKVAWLMKDQPPIKCTATGGRMISNFQGNIFDHMTVVYEYANGVRATVAQRQIPGCYNDNSDYIMGANGYAIVNGWKDQHEIVTDGKTWQSEVKKNDMYQQEHDELFAAIRSGKPINNGVRMTNSTAMAIMARMSAYTGQEDLTRVVKEPMT